MQQELAVRRARTRRVWQISFFVACLMVSWLVWQSVSKEQSSTTGAPKTNTVAERFSQAPDRANLPKMYNWNAADLFEDKTQLALCAAISEGDKSEVRKLIDDGANIDQPGKDGFTMLHWALACDNLAAFKQLLDNGADPDRRLDETFMFSDIWGYFYKGETVSFCAASLFRTDFIKAAWVYTNEPDQRNRFGFTMLQQLAVRDYPTSPELLLMVIGSRADLNLKSPLGATPLESSCSSGVNQFRTAMLLLRAGANPEFCADGVDGLRRRLERHKQKFEAEQDHEGVAAVMAVMEQLQATPVETTQ